MARISARGRRNDGVSIKDQWKAKGRQEGKRWLARAWDSRVAKYTSKAFSDLDAANLWGKDMRAKTQLGLDGAGSCPLAEATVLYTADLRRLGRTEKHIRDVEVTLANALAHGVKDLRDDRVKDQVRAWLTKGVSTHPRTLGREISATTRNKRQAIIKGLVAFLLAEDRLVRDPLVGLRRETDRTAGKLRAVFMPHELKVLVADRPKDPWWLPLCMLIYTGMRLGELGAVRWSWIRWDLKCIEVRQEDGSDGGDPFSPKRHHERRIPLEPELADLLKPLEKPAGVIFPDVARLSRTMQTRLVVAAIKKAKVEPDGRTAHCLRHAWVSLRLARGVPSLTVQAEAGHSTITTTQGYFHALPAEAVAGWPQDGSLWLRRDIPKPDAVKAASSAKIEKAASSVPPPG